MPTPAEILAATGSVLTAKAKSIRDGDQQAELRDVSDIRDGLALSSEVDALDSGVHPSRMIMKADPVTL